MRDRTLRIRQNIWCVYPQELSRLHKRTDVDASWNLWSQEVEASLIRACQAEGGPVLAGHPSFLGGARFFLRTKQLRGRCKDLKNHTDHASPVNAADVGFSLTLHLPWIFSSAAG